MVWQRKYIFVDSKRTTTMKTAIKLAFIYLAMQILGALAVGPFTMIYAYVKYGTIDRANEFALAPTLLAGFVLC